MTNDEPVNANPTTALTALMTWLKQHWTAYLFADQDNIKVLRAETIASADGSSYMRWWVATRG